MPNGLRILILHTTQTTYYLNDPVLCYFATQFFWFQNRLNCLHHSKHYLPFSYLYMTLSTRDGSFFFLIFQHVLIPPSCSILSSSQWRSTNKFCACAALFISTTRIHQSNMNVSFWIIPLKIVTIRANIIKILVLKPILHERI